MAGDGLVELGARPTGLAAALDALPEEAGREAVGGDAEDDHDLARSADLPARALP